MGEPQELLVLMGGKMGGPPGRKSSAAVSAEHGAEACVLLTLTPFFSSVVLLSPLTVRQLDIYANSLGKAEGINAETQELESQEAKFSSLNSGTSGNWVSSSLCYN